MNYSIVILNWRDPWNPRAGGAENVTLKHAVAWQKKGHTVTWITSMYEGALAQEKKQGILYKRGGSEHFFWLNARHFFKLHSQNKKTDIIIDQIHGLPSFSPLWSGTVPLIAFIHELAMEIWFHMYPLPVAILGWLSEKMWLRLVYHSTQFWVDSNSTATDLVNNGVRPSSCTVIPCAIDHHTQISAHKSEHLSMIFLARLVPMKGAMHALETLRHIVRQIPSAQLWIVGGGSTAYTKLLEQTISQHRLKKSVHWFGKVSEAKKFNLLKKAHFLIHTSVKEGFGLTVLEAFSQKTPVACYDVPSLNELVEDSKTGVVAPFGSTEILANKIITLYKNASAYARMQQLASNFEAQFTWKKATNSSMAMLHTLIKNKYISFS